MGMEEKGPLGTVPELGDGLWPWHLCPCLLIAPQPGAAKDEAAKPPPPGHAAAPGMPSAHHPSQQGLPKVTSKPGPAPKASAAPSPMTAPSPMMCIPGLPGLPHPQGISPVNPPIGSRRVKVSHPAFWYPGHENRGRSGSMPALTPFCHKGDFQCCFRN